MPWLLVGLVVLLALGAGSRAPVPAPRAPGAPQPPAPPPGADPAPPAAPAPMPRPNFVEFAPLPEELELEPGETYVAQANVPFLLGALVGERQIREALEAEGFVVIRATSSRPGFWPSDDVADWYLVASYTGDRRPKALPSGITRLWRAAARDVVDSV